MKLEMLKKGFAKTDELYLIKVADEPLTYVRHDDLIFDQEKFLKYYAEWAGFNFEDLSLHYAGRVLHLEK